MVVWCSGRFFLFFLSRFSSHSCTKVFRWLFGFWGAKRLWIMSFSGGIKKIWYNSHYECFKWQFRKKRKCTSFLHHHIDPTQAVCSIQNNLPLSVHVWQTCGCELAE